MKILIADESELICAFIANMLENSNKENEIAFSTSQESALQKITELNPEIIIIDIAGIKLNGSKLIQSLNKNNLPKTIIFTSQFDDAEYQEKAEELNGHFLCKKNLEDITKLLETIV